MLVLSKAFYNLGFSREQSKTFPNNMAWLGLFTLCESHLVSVTTSFYTPETVFLCALATVAATLGLTLYAMTTKSDFTSIGNSVTGKFFFIFKLLDWHYSMLFSGSVWSIFSSSEAQLWTFSSQLHWLSFIQFIC